MLAMLATGTSSGELCLMYSRSCTVRVAILLHQSRAHGPCPSAFRAFFLLTRDSGIARLYQGLLPWAIFQAPLSRFGDVAANDMVLALMGALFPQAPGLTQWNNPLLPSTVTFPDLPTAC